MLIDLERWKQQSGRDRVREALKEVVKRFRGLRLVWIPRTVEEEFAIKDKAKRKRAFLYEDLQRFFGRLAIRVSPCPLLAKPLPKELSEMFKQLAPGGSGCSADGTTAECSDTELAEKFEQLDPGECDALHQAFQVRRTKKYQHYGVVILSDDDALCKLSRCVTKCQIRIEYFRRNKSHCENIEGCVGEHTP